MQKIQKSLYLRTSPQRRGVMEARLQAVSVEVLDERNVEPREV